MKQRALLVGAGGGWGKTWATGVLPRAIGEGLIHVVGVVDPVETHRLAAAEALGLTSAQCYASFTIQGSGEIEIDGEKTPIGAGDIMVVEPGEDHHLISSERKPLVVLWGHTGNREHKKQHQGGRTG